MVAANEILTNNGSSTQPAHDAAGNMTKVPKWQADLPNHISCTYDAWNRLVLSALDTNRPLLRGDAIIYKDICTSKKLRNRSLEYSNICAHCIGRACCRNSRACRLLSLHSTITSSDHHAPCAHPNNQGCVAVMACARDHGFCQPPHAEDDKRRRRWCKRKLRADFELHAGLFKASAPAFPRLFHSLPHFSNSSVVRQSD